jgi:tetratricopeptide (TPR) repeat protein
MKTWKTLAAAALLLGLAGAPLTMVRASTEGESAARRGIESYLAGHYDQALPDLEKARDGGASSGSLLYMLGFCYESVRHDTAASTAAFDASFEALKKETEQPKPALESYFYLSNLYLNRRDADGSKKAAGAGTAAIESKKIKVPKDGVSQFRAGKLYADAGNSEKALEYHRRAVTAFKKDDAPPPEYYRRSLETVAAGDHGKGDAEDMADTWEKLVAMNPSMTDGDWNLGVASMRAARFEQAKAAFERARKAGGDRSQDAYYAAGLAAGGLEVTQAGLKIPKKDKDGKVIATLDDEAIDARIKTVITEAGPLLNREVKVGEYQLVVNERGKKRVAPAGKLASQLGDLHARFVALVTEMLVRNKSSLQTKSFEGSYSPLVIQTWKSLWANAHRDLQNQLVPPPPDATPADGTATNPS